VLDPVVVQGQQGDDPIGRVRYPDLLIHKYHPLEVAAYLAIAVDGRGNRGDGRQTRPKPHVGDDLAFPSASASNPHPTS
jgi:hypothetical protein